MLTRIASDTHEAVYRIEAPKAGLRGFIGLHSTRRGPAAGGVRLRRYDSDEAALRDVLRLSEGMSYKCAACDLPLGGGKAVILGDPATDKTPELLRAFGRAVEELGGAYRTAEDMGMTPADMAIVAQETDHAAGRDDGPFASGDPSPVTARGIFAAIRRGAAARLGSDDLRGRRVALQGLGHVGMHLAERLHATGARLVVSDLSEAACRDAAARFGAEIAAPDSILSARADILVPCAIGAVLNDKTIPTIEAALVAGGANNQLAAPEDADRLHRRGILYVPDYMANGGGIISASTEILRIEDRDGWVRTHLEALDDRIGRVLDRAAREDRSPAHVADAMVRDMLTQKAA